MNLSLNRSAQLALLLAGVACQVYDESLLDHAPSAGGSAGSAGVGQPGGFSGLGGSVGGGGTLVGAGFGGGGASGAGSAGLGGGGAVAGSGGNAGTGGASGAGGGTGGAVGGAGSSGAAGSGAGTASVPQLLIDDLEDQNGTLKRPGYTGVWFTASDEMEGDGTLVPMGGSTFAPEELDPPVGDSSWAAHVSGEWTGWGALLGFSFLAVPAGQTKAPPFDASAYTGIRFSAKIDDPDTLIRFEVIIPRTEPDSDHFGMTPTLTEEWTEISVAFSALEKPTWSTSGAEWDASAIRTVQFKFDSGVPFDLWVDDVYFIEE